MVCPKCMVQMHQAQNGYGEFIGGGFAEETDYLTWELKQCPMCFDYYVEVYRTALLEPATSFPNHEDVEQFVRDLFKKDLK